jgi:NAD(P)-dependent dehydrogenase (short-subunit alcohol dehydrogenase family)
MRNPMDLTGRRILVTGASSGIGRATSVLLSELGATLVLNGRNLEGLGMTLSLCHGTGHRLAPFDLSDSDAIPGWEKDITAEHGPLWGAVHCAGSQLVRPLQITTSQQIDDLLVVNVTAALMIAKGFRQKGVTRGGGSLVFVSSVMGQVGSAGRAAYCASKGGVDSLAKAMALELVRDQIRVNCVAPGFVQTDMLESAVNQLGASQMAEIERLHPLGFGKPLDVAMAIAFFLSDASQWITGSILTVDGGYTAQ